MGKVQRETSATMGRLIHRLAMPNKDRWWQKTHNERYRDCKENLHSLLSAIYEGVQVNYDIDFPSKIEDLANTNIHTDLAP